MFEEGSFRYELEELRFGYEMVVFSGFFAWTWSSCGIFSNAVRVRVSEIRGEEQDSLSLVKISLTADAESILARKLIQEAFQEGALSYARWTT